MNDRTGWVFLCVFFGGLLLFLVIFQGYILPGEVSSQRDQAARSVSGSSYVVLAWNDLGMHCYNQDFSDLAVLPPYNTLWAQVIKVGDPPQLVTSGIQVSYSFPDNTYSVGKTNFWSYAQPLFNLPNPLPDNVGLKGKGLSGQMDLIEDHFVAEGIPLTEFSDSAPLVSSPYQLAQVTVMDSATQAVLAQTRVVAPVSSELHCENCHRDTGDATVQGGILPTGKVETNILTLHDTLELQKYPSGHSEALMGRRPVLCAECHASNALGEPGVEGVACLSNAIHHRHSGLDDITPDTQGCYNCHPGSSTRYLRDVMSQKYQVTCVSCHGDMTQVAANPSPWLNEPRCDTCHGLNAFQNRPLFRFSTSSSGLYCEACHDSTHAIAPSREPNDAIKFTTLQGRSGALKDCDVCHLNAPTGVFPHVSIIYPLQFSNRILTNNAAHE